MRWAHTRLTGRHVEDQGSRHGEVDIGGTDQCASSRRQWDSHSSSGAKETPVDRLKVGDCRAGEDGEGP